MVDLFILAYLIAPILLGAVAVWFVLTRPSDRIQMATTALFSCTLLYAVNAYRFLSHGALALLLGVGLGVYALALYVAMGALAIYTMRWAWRVAVAAFGLHIAVGLVLVSTSSPLSGQDLLSLTIYFAIGAIGLWATLHSGTRAAVTAAHATRVE